MKKKRKKSTEDLFIETGKYETCAKFQQKTLNSMEAGARRNFEFSRQTIKFVRNNRALSKFKK